MKENDTGRGPTPNENILDGLIESYRDFPLARIFAAALPLGGALNVAMAVQSDRIARERLKILEEALASEGCPITEEMLHSDEITHRIVITMRAATYCRSAEKIRLFARLFATAGAHEDFSGDEFEEFAQVLETLSARELSVLIALDLRRAPHDADATPVQRTSTYWDAFEDDLVSMGIERDQHDGILARLGRTGLYREITGTFTDYAGGQGELTGLWERFRTFVLDRRDIETEAATVRKGYSGASSDVTTSQRETT